MVRITETEKIEVVTLIDNYTDVLLSSFEKIKRSPHYRNGEIVPPLVAEHGLSLLIKVFANGKAHSILFDAGWSKTGIIHNLNQMEINLREIEGVVLSHGHMDHWGGLAGILGLISLPIPVVVHPDVFLSQRFLVLDNGEKIRFPILKEEIFATTCARIIKNSVPYLIADGLILISGEIERKVAFEKGISNAYVEREGKIEPDLMLDDQGLIIYLNNKGLVIITGCAHSGIINTIKYAQKLTGIDSVYAVIGGFHLGGPKFEPVISPTLTELTQIKPEVICPMHCTGFKAIMEIAKSMPNQLLINSVGSTLVLDSGR